MCLGKGPPILNCHTLNNGFKSYGHFSQVWSLVLYICQNLLSQIILIQKSLEFHYQCLANCFSCLKQPYGWRKLKEHR
jgi:hypothetical protein